MNFTKTLLLLVSSLCVLCSTTVPMLTLIIGGSYVAGNYTMCGKQAAQTILDINIAAMKRAGQEPDAEELEALRKKVTDAYDTSTDIRYAAARGWVDGIIDPADTRKVLIQSLESVTLHAEPEPFRTGVFQV